MIPLNVLIVGGGRTAWMAAAYLNAALGDTGLRPAALQVLESPDYAGRTAAEAAIPEIGQILAVIGIDEKEFLKRVRGTFRLATRYDNWLRGTGDFFYHPLDDARAQPMDRAAHDWLRSDRSIAFAETVSPQPIICELGLAPRPIDGPPPGLRLKYSYHADQQGFTDLLRDIALSRGVEQVSDRLADVEIGEAGNIEAVITRGGARLKADLFIDCTGTDASLIGRVLGDDWIDCSRWLLCDRALTMSVPYEQSFRGTVNPYTSATALSAGWVRDVPLQDRRSLTYVYSDRHIDEAAARKELQAYEGPHASDLKTEASAFDVGHRSAAWIGNCVSLGGSAGLLEPLESADQCLSDLGTMTLAECFPLGDEMASCEYRFNQIMGNRFYEILDFVNLQYCLTKRSDTEFWRDVSSPEHINDRNAAKLDFWRHKAPSRSDFIDPFFPGQPDAGIAGDRRGAVDTSVVFGLERHEATLYGMQFLAEECDDWFGTARPSTQVPAYIVNDIRRARALLPPQDVFLRRAAGMADYSTSRGPQR